MAGDTGAGAQRGNYLDLVVARQAAAALCRALVEFLDVIAKQHGRRITEGRLLENGASWSLDRSGRWRAYCCQPYSSEHAAS
jgi:hypothetical protein